ncbi:hypothetical protein SNEBB_010498, partial [Seison nebaliae]
FCSSKLLSAIREFEWKIVRIPVKNNNKRNSSRREHRQLDSDSVRQLYSKMISDENDQILSPRKQRILDKHFYDTKPLINSLIVNSMINNSTTTTTTSRLSEMKDVTTITTTAGITTMSDSCEIMTSSFGNKKNENWEEKEEEMKMKSKLPLSTKKRKRELSNNETMELMDVVNENEKFLNQELSLQSNEMVKIATFVSSNICTTSSSLIYSSTSSSTVSSSNILPQQQQQQSLINSDEINQSSSPNREQMKNVSLSDMETNVSSNCQIQLHNQQQQQRQWQENEGLSSRTDMFEVETNNKLSKERNDTRKPAVRRVRRTKRVSTKSMTPGRKMQKSRTADYNSLRMPPSFLTSSFPNATNSALSTTTTTTVAMSSGSAICWNYYDASNRHLTAEQEQQKKSHFEMAREHLKKNQSTRSTQTRLLMKQIRLKSNWLSENQSEEIYEENEENDLDEKLKEMQRKLQKTEMELKKTTMELNEKNETIMKSVELNQKLLIQHADFLAKQSRRECMENRLRLGQFITQRQGATFCEQWIDGCSFNDIQKRQEQVNKARDELEKEKRSTMKKKQTLTELTKKRTTTTTTTTITNNSVPESISNPLNITPTLSATRIPVTSVVASGSSALSNNSLQSIDDQIFEYRLMEFAEQEDILRLRGQSLKKEEQDIQISLERLERERNLHIRQIKRIHNEDHSRFKNHPILHQRYLLLSLIGKGGFSEVHKGFDLKEQKYVACKVHQLTKEWRDEKKVNYIKHALREYDIHKTLDHPRIVRLFDVFEIDNNSFCTILEYCEGNDLDFHLKQHKTIPEKEARSIVMQMISALVYLNTEVRPPVIHYDLKPGNILLGTDENSGEIKITDFGLSKQMDDEHYDPDYGMDLTSQGAGTYWYLPPEVFVLNGKPPKISSKVDVWSIGCIFYQCLYGKKPFGHNESQASILENQTILKAREVEFLPRPSVSNEAKQFIRRCLCYQVKHRPDVLQLLDDDYFRSSCRIRSSINSTSNLFYTKRSNPSSDSFSRR